jgi:hypothetical protein
MIESNMQIILPAFERRTEQIDDDTHFITIYSQLLVRIYSRSGLKFTPSSSMKYVLCIQLINIYKPDPDIVKCVVHPLIKANEITYDYPKHIIPSEFYVPPGKGYNNNLDKNVFVNNDDYENDAIALKLNARSIMNALIYNLSELGHMYNRVNFISIPEYIDVIIQNNVRALVSKISIFDLPCVGHTNLKLVLSQYPQFLESTKYTNSTIDGMNECSQALSFIHTQCLIVWSTAFMFSTFYTNMTDIERATQLITDLSNVNLIQKGKLTSFARSSIIQTIRGIFAGSLDVADPNPNDDATRIEGPELDNASGPEPNTASTLDDGHPAAEIYKQLNIKMTLPIYTLNATSGFSEAYQCMYKFGEDFAGLFAGFLTIRLNAIELFRRHVLKYNKLCKPIDMQLGALSSKTGITQDDIDRLKKVLMIQNNVEFATKELTAAMRNIENQATISRTHNVTRENQEKQEEAKADEAAAPQGATGTRGGKRIRYTKTRYPRNRNMRRSIKHYSN